MFLTTALRHAEGWEPCSEVQAQGTQQPRAGTGPCHHLLKPHGNEGHGHHQQVQDVEVVAAEGTFVQEGSIGGHLERERET